MKKLTAILLTLCVSVALVGCGGEEKTPKKADPAKTPPAKTDTK